MTINSLQASFVSRSGAFLFISGKLIRFTFFLFLLVTLAQGTGALKGYNLNQVIFFFLTFNLVDIFAQSLFREVYHFRSVVMSGDFDLVLVKPIHPLIRVLLGGADGMDMITLVPLIGAIAYYVPQLGGVSGVNIIFYILLVINALILATGFHIISLVVGILTTAVDQTIWIYRDLTSMGRIPVDFYNQILRALLFFAIPVGIMMTIPAKALMGLLSPPMLIYSFVFGVLFLWASFRLFHWSLSRYSSASS
ncbi:MAG: ABC-2 family transporter protein [Candidatus Blackburnbacteria bacterium]|nr:ABC-2 family transporter protein [Candidatus Blackburnbacteria bacterium]